MLPLPWFHSSSLLKLSKFETYTQGNRTGFEWMFSCVAYNEFWKAFRKTGYCGQTIMEMHRHCVEAQSLHTAVLHYLARVADTIWCPTGSYLGLKMESASRKLGQDTEKQCLLTPEKVPLDWIIPIRWHRISVLLEHGADKHHQIGNKLECLIVIWRLREFPARPLSRYRS